MNGTALIRIGADSADFRQGLASIKSEFGGFAKQIAAVAGGQALFAGVRMAVQGVANAFSAVGDLVKESVDAASQFESVTAQFTTFYKSAETAQSVVKELAKYAATTSFELGEVANAGASLAGAGVPAEQLKESIRVIGDIAAATRRPMAEILQPYVKALSVGKVQTETFMQFLERGIPLGEALKKALNLNDVGLQKALEGGQISAQQLVNALQEITTTGLFAGAATEQGKTLAGIISTLKDNVTEVKTAIGLAASSGFKPLLSAAQELVQKLLPLGKALGGLFASAAESSLKFAKSFETNFADAIAFGVKAFQIIEGSLRNGTLFQILALSGKIAFNEILDSAVRAVQGITAVFQNNVQFDSFFGEFGKTLDGLAAIIKPTLIPAFEALGDAFFEYVTNGIKKIPQALGAVWDAAFSSTSTSMLGPKTLKGIQEQRAKEFDTGMLESPYSYASGALSVDEASEMMAAERAGYPIPLMASEVRESFAGGKRITYNARESLQNGAIIPPSNAYAEGGMPKGFVEAFQAGYRENTKATQNLANQNERLRAELAKLADAALKQTQVQKQQIAELEQTNKLTAKTPEKGPAKALKAEFTALERIGGGARRMNLAARPAEEGEGLKAAALNPAAALGGGFANSEKFIKAKKEEEERKKKALADLEFMRNLQGPPSLPFFQEERRLLRTPRMDFDVPPPFPKIEGMQMPEPGDPAVRALHRAKYYMSPERPGYLQEEVDRMKAGEPTAMLNKLDAILHAIEKQGSLDLMAV